MNMFDRFFNAFYLNFVLCVCDFYRWILLLYLVFESFVLREVSFITTREGGLLKLETYVEKISVLSKLLFCSSLEES